VTKKVLFGRSNQLSLASAPTLRLRGLEFLTADPSAEALAQAEAQGHKVGAEISFI